MSVYGFTANKGLASKLNAKILSQKVMFATKFEHRNGGVCFLHFREWRCAIFFQSCTKTLLYLFKETLSSRLSSYIYI